MCSMLDPRSDDAMIVLVFGGDYVCGVLASRVREHFGQIRTRVMKKKNIYITHQQTIKSHTFLSRKHVKFVFSFGWIRVFDIRVWFCECVVFKLELEPRESPSIARQLDLIVFCIHTDVSFHRKGVNMLRGDY